MGITYSECVSVVFIYPACKSHRLCAVLLSSVACMVLLFFLRYLIKGMIFGKKLFKVKCAF